MDDFDVVVVGARCAGSPLATILARRGLRVCLFDRADFPSETPSTHVIQPVGVQLLDKLGVLDAVWAAGGVPLTRFAMIVDDVRIDAEIGRTRPGVCVRRQTLDALLVEAASAAGVEVRTKTRVLGVIGDDDGRVVGVETDTGPVHARTTVGADGRHSTIADAVGAQEYLVTEGGRMPVWGYFENAAGTEGLLRVGGLGDVGYLAAPTDGGLFMAGLAVPMNAAKAFHADRERNFAHSLAAWPEFADVLAGARRVGPIRVMSKWHGYFRPAAGPGWVLVGDAGHFKDPTPAQGISDALRQAHALADAIVAGGDSPDERLREWWRWRDADAYDMYWLATDMGVPRPTTPLKLNVLRQVARPGSGPDDLLRVLDHEVPSTHLFTTGRLLRATGATMRANPRQIPATTREIASTVGDQVRREVDRRRIRRRTV